MMIKEHLRLEVHSMFIGGSAQIAHYGYMYPNVGTIDKCLVVVANPTTSKHPFAANWTG
jgi:hypothetical protein